ncbi:hypothetical protein Halru_2875 [Halovivax ruber XH-70]|uniref:DUF7982 domain-containing protein n=1 Tax=Halovivax ruber (strain DSM 18193 / JCM 13892 / XH-70) TaxID=797302 RepID=L0ID19_HALRX|nr:hypothetical protein [Halovivax ruber]AGB17445.1 hypothetical protein Halru_2875 [Halovivax ruber XH-70]
MNQHDTDRDDSATNHTPFERAEHRGTQSATDERPANDAPAERNTEASTTPSSGELAAQVELLADENARLRTKYASAKRVRYRRTALGLAGVGLLAIVGALAVPTGQDVLFVLGATGLFGALLTAVLTPERFVAASVGERIYEALAANHAALVDELGLRSEPRYLPGTSSVAPKVFVPQRADTSSPTGETGPIVTDEDRRGLLFEPTGAGLYTAFVQATPDNPPTAPAVLAGQLADAVVDQFELARAVDPDVVGDRVTFAVTDGAFGPLDRFDHPIPSFFAVSLAASRGRPVRLTVYPGDDRADWLVTCWWADSSDGTDGDSTAQEPASAGS